MPIGKKNPIAYKIKTVSNKSKINLNLAPGGGTDKFEPIKYYYILHFK
jgi:hypothetical protein